MANACALADLELIAANYPLSLHAVGLSLGSAEGVDRAHLERLKALVQRLAPALVSDHLSWSASDGHYLPDLLPLPYTEEALRVVSRNVEKVQQSLGRKILVENPSTYLQFSASAIPEAEFLAALARATGCGVLFDVNNVYVSASNQQLEPSAVLAQWCRALDAPSVGEIHLAGHALVATSEGRALRIDDHGDHVCEAVWSLYEQALAHFGAAPDADRMGHAPARRSACCRPKRRSHKRGSMNASGRVYDAPSDIDAGLAPGAHGRGLARRRCRGAAAAGRTGSAGAHRGRGGFARASQYRARRAQQRAAPELRAVDRLVGEAFFDRMAVEYARAAPPSAPQLDVYGSGFAELHRRVSRHRAPAVPERAGAIGLAACRIRPRALLSRGRSGAAARGRRAIALCRAAAHFRSAYPVDRLRAAILADDVEALRSVDLEPRASITYALWRSEAGVNVRSLSAIRRVFSTRCWQGPMARRRSRPPPAHSRAPRKSPRHLTREILPAGFVRVGTADP